MSGVAYARYTRVFHSTQCYNLYEMTIGQKR